MDYVFEAGVGEVGVNHKVGGKKKPFSTHIYQTVYRQRSPFVEGVAALVAKQREAGFIYRVT